MSSKPQIADLIVLRCLAPDRREAEALILAGKVWIDGERVKHAGERVPADAAIEIRPARKHAFASRAGLKLEAALRQFNIDLRGAVAADLGASTGGFTSVLLARGIAKVFAIDVGYGDLAWEVRQDSRVIPIERTNVRTLAQLPEPVDFICADLSFISLRLIVPRFAAWWSKNVQQLHGAVVLFKPQFEAPRELVPEGGVIADPHIHAQLLLDWAAWCERLPIAICGAMPSPISGTKGNREFLFWLHPARPPIQNLPHIIESIAQTTENPET